MPGNFSHRLAQESDIPEIKALMNESINHLQKTFLNKEQIEASYEIMGLDTELISDQTYFVILHGENTPEETIVGCGGWGKRKTLYGGNHSLNRDKSLLDPKTDAARIRAMYTHPDWARKGIGKIIITLCEDAARNAGFTRFIMGSTLAGQPLYETCGYKVQETKDIVTSKGVIVPVLTMGKVIAD